MSWARRGETSPAWTGADLDVTDAAAVTDAIAASGPMSW